jgi:UDP-glucose 4-epimerase/GDP-4-dehydro-6-deoxy-D-mannose reductase
MSELFEKPDFVPQFTDFDTLRSGSIGLTGQRGALGSILSDRLMRADVDVQAFPGDVNDASAVDQWVGARRFAHFFHFAAVVPVVRVEAEPLRAFQTNVIGTFNIGRAIALTQKQCWLFHASSSHVYRPTPQPTPIAEDAACVPQNFYGATKLAAEQILTPVLDRLGVAYCVARIFSFSHTTQPQAYLVPGLSARVAAATDGSTFDVRNPSSVRDIQDAETVVDCILHLARLRAQGVVNVGTGRGLSVRDIALAVARVAGKRIEVVGKDIEVPGALIADTTKLRSMLAQGTAE